MTVAEYTSALATDAKFHELLKTGLYGDTTAFRNVLREIADGAKASGDGNLGNILEQLLGDAGRIERPLTLEEKKAAFSRTISDDAEIPLGLSSVKTDVTMENVILPAHAKEAVEDFIEEQGEPELYLQNNLAPKNKMMLMGPPGNGKTALIKAIANRMGLPLYFVRYDALTSAKPGETSKRLHAIFEFAKSHRCILFFDEVDAIAKARGGKDDAEMERVVSTLLVQLDDVPAHVLVLGATNHPQMLDKAIWRRFQNRMQLPDPGTDEYEAYLIQAFGRWGHKPDHNLRILAVRLAAENFADAEVFVEDVIRKFVKAKGQITIEQAIEKGIIAWPKTRMKVAA